MKKQYWILSIGLLLIIAVALTAYFYFRNNPAGDSSNFKGEEYSDRIDLNLSPTKKVSLMAVGDIMLSRDVATKIKKYQDYKYPFLKTTELFKKADLTFGNLETPITPGRVIHTNELTFRSDPEVVEGLIYAGFDILSLANNHTMNFGEKGLKDTLNYLKEAGISYIGAGENRVEAYQPVIKEVKGLKFAFLAYNDTNMVPASYEATENRAGTAFMDIETMQEDVKKAQARADFVIVSMHSGREYTFIPNNRQEEFAHKAIEAGAILVLGHHPHVVQTMEKYQDGYILYSLGNFVFDQMWSQETREGLIAEIIFSPEGIWGIELYPIIIEDFAQPRFATEIEQEPILKRLAQDFKNQPFYYGNSQGYKEGSRKGIYLDKSNTFRNTEQEIDIDGDGKREKALIKDNQVSIYKNNELVWQSNPAWSAENVVVGDIDNDEKNEIIVSLWKLGKYGSDLPFWLEENIKDWGNHLFIYKWPEEGIKLFWGSSTLDAPIREMAVADVDEDGQNELIVLEGSYEESIDQPAEYVTAWAWKEWNLFNEFRSKESRFFDLDIKNLGDRKVIFVKK